MLSMAAIGIALILGIATLGAGRYFGLGRRWERLAPVRKSPILR